MKIFRIIYDFLEELFKGSTPSTAWTNAKFYNEED